MKANFALALEDEAPETVLKQIETPYGAPQVVHPVQANPYDLAPVKAALAPYLAKIDDMSAKAGAVTILDDDGNVTAIEMAGQAKRLGKAVEEARKGFVAAPGEYVKSINMLAKSFTEKLAAIESGLKKKIDDYRYRAEMERRKAEQKTKEEHAALQVKIDAEAKAANVEPVKIQAPVVPEAPKNVKTAEGTAYTFTEWRFEVVKESEVPREYLMVDQAKIRQAVKDGLRQIPGGKIFEHSETRIRR